MRSSLFWDVMQRGLVVVRHFETTYRCHLQGFRHFKNGSNLEDGTDMRNMSED